MSDKRFTTDEIIESLQSVMNVLFAERAYSTIARLRAADKLCEAAIAAKGFIEIYGGTTERLSKAITEYDGKEE